MDDKPIIIIDEKPEAEPGQPEGEAPRIIIERDDDDEEGGTASRKPAHRWARFVLEGAVALLCCLVVMGAYWYDHRYVNIGIPVSVTSRQNIARLRQPAVAVRPEVVMSTDSILGVGFNLYELRGLKAEVTLAEPDTTDHDVYLYSRSADFSSYDIGENKYLGSLVLSGKPLQSDNSRLGYCAMANGNVVIGVARDERVMDYCVEHGGSFFRQFVLVSCGVLPSRFYLHGKVERRALGRMGDRLYYIESHGREGMYEFADALREYGFTDAIYITGGSDYSFYRTADGVPHDIGDLSRRGKRRKGAGIVPWVVFRRR